MTALHIEMAARMPWLHARDGSWWEVSGSTNPQWTFTDCLARVVDTAISESKIPIFEVLMLGKPLVVSADRITRGREVLLTYMDDPTRAVYESDQDVLDRALRG